MSWFFHPKPIDSARCFCPCHWALGEPKDGVLKDGSTDASVAAALTACRECFPQHRRAFLPEPQKPKPPQNWESGEEGG